MKGSRAKKAAEAEAAAATGELEPTPPSGSPTSPPRPGLKAGQLVQLSKSEFEKIVSQIRTNELLGAAAADSLEAAAGQRPVASPQSKGAQELREKTASSRKGGGMKFDAEVEEVPDIPEKQVSEEPKKRASLSDDIPDGHDIEEMAKHVEKDAPEPPELNLNPKQNGMRTDLEMWVMDEIPALYGVDDSEELPEELQEDGQADSITFLIAQTDEGKQKELLDKWLGHQECPDADKKEEFMNEVLEKVRAIQALSVKKKKKKKKAES